MKALKEYIPSIQRVGQLTASMISREEAEKTFSGKKIEECKKIMAIKGLSWVPEKAEGRDLRDVLLDVGAL